MGTVSLAPACEAALAAFTPVADDPERRLTLRQANRREVSWIALRLTPGALAAIGPVALLLVR